MKHLALAFAILLLTGCASSTPSGSSSSRHWALRLSPGADLRQSIEKFATEHSIRAAYVGTCVGSLNHASIRFAENHDTTIVEGPLEIVSLTGTLSVYGAHLHVAVSDGRGQTVGGHLNAGSPVHTTAEIVIVELPQLVFDRDVDPATTWKELVIRDAPARHP
jgi:predicted DNA-binding protein with PD1-like motif